MGLPSINTRADLDAITGTPEHVAFMALLAGSLWRVEKDDTAQTWVAIEDNSTIERFGFTRADFPGAVPPELPVYVPQPDTRMADLDAHIAAIKAKAGQIILARLPDYKQRNYLTRKAELQDVLIAGGTLSASEQAEWDFFAAQWAWAKAVRETSNAAELAGTPVDEIVWPT